MCHRTAKLRQCQQRRVARRMQHADHGELYTLLHDPSLFSIIDEEQPEHRRRLYPPTVTLGTFISQALDADGSCQAAVNRIMMDRVLTQQVPGSVSTGAYCRARQRLPTPMVARLARHSGEALADEAPPEWLWQGRSVKLVDGTTVSMPDTVENQRRFPQQASQPAGLGFPLARLVAIIDRGSGAVLDAAMGPLKGKGTGEHALLREMLDTLERGDIVVADRYYASFALIAELLSRGVDVVMQQHAARRTDCRQGQRLGVKDHITTWQKPKRRPEWMTPAQYDALPETLRIRELAMGNKVVVTTLLSSQEAPREQLKALYRERWRIELNLRDIKTTLGMEVLRCKTPEMVEKELWVYLLAYNLIRRLMTRAAALADTLPRHVSFKHTLQLFRETAYGSRLTASALDEMMTLIVGLVVGTRPDRVEPRAIKRRPKPYPLLKKPRPTAREDIRQHGHPRKLK